MRYITNAFSVNMFAKLVDVTVLFDRITPEAAAELVRDGCTSAIGHEDTARLFSSIVGEVPANRITIELAEGDELVVGQYTGPRLEPGAVELPLGATITWWYIRIVYAGELEA